MVMEARPRTRTTPAAPETRMGTEGDVIGAHKPSAITRNAKPAPPPAPRTRTRAQASTPVPVHGLVTGSVEVEHKAHGQTVAHVRDYVSHPRTLPGAGAPYATVSVGGGTTICPVQYESVRIDVRLSLPSLPDPASYQEAYEEAAVWVERIIGEQVSAALAGNG